MAKAIMVDVSCSCCFKLHGTFKKKEMPKRFVCQHCGVGQQAERPGGVGFTHGRNYPDDYYPAKMSF